MNFNWTNPYPTVRTPVFARNLVATSQPLAAQAGLRMLQAGGNAADAAVAAAAVITMTEPCSNGLGADNFAIVWDPARRELLGLNSSGIAPAAWSLDGFRRKYGDDLAKNRPVRGWDTVTTPGAVAGWSLLHGRLGKLSFADVLAPAIEYAERGFAVSPVVHDKWLRAVPLLKNGPGFAGHFLPNGRAPEIGEHFVLPGADRTFKLLARHGAEAFYRGEIAEGIERHARATGGDLRASDLAAYWEFVQNNGWVGTLGTRFHGHELHEIPPNGQGIAALSCLGILRHTNLAEYAVDSADWQHVAIEAMKLAFADTYAYVADARAMTVSPADMLDDDYLAQRARRIDMQRAQAFSAGSPPRGGTIYLTAADAGGMMVSLIQSNYMGFGSGVVVPGYGISLQNRGHGFSVDAASANVIAPGKRPFHTIIPGFLMKDGRPAMSFGVMGGNMQPQGHVQTLVRMLLAQQQPQAACDAPRWKVMEGVDLEVEGTMPAAVVEELRSRGHHVTSGNDSYMDFGSGQFIWRLGDPAVEGYVAASDSRRDGLVAGC
ncbi:MAG TPA: gamma-glutamyltransferase family protein [Burkholderiaceae bacterium]|nr:gamma-glutamyltransferase family protein [Burkholderiaceae bacterium]